MADIRDGHQETILLRFVTGSSHVTLWSCMLLRVLSRLQDLDSSSSSSLLDQLGERL